MEEEEEGEERGLSLCVITVDRKRGGGDTYSIKGGSAIHKLATEPQFFKGSFVI